MPSRPARGHIRGSGGVRVRGSGSAAGLAAARSRDLAFGS